ncbi:MAG: hypothetical protein AABY10_04075 [Nanoarchaeota archaeon]
MVNESKKNDPRFWNKWYKAGAIRSEAYAFFDCDAPIDRIAEEIPTIRKLVETPRKLELHLSEISQADIKRYDSKLSEIASEAREADMRYVLSAKSTDMTNHQLADELSAILNQAYQSSLYNDGEDFRGGIFYKEEGRYISRE